LAKGNAGGFGEVTAAGALVAMATLVEPVFVFTTAGIVGTD